jgi:hypothetical protein
MTMAKWVHDDVLDEALSYIKNNCTRMTLCSAQPGNYTEGNATYKLADVTMAVGDFTIQAGDVSGRKVIVASKTGVTVDTTGSATHVVLLDVSNTKLLYVTTCVAQSLTAGNTVDIPAWDVEITDPS